MLDAFHLRSAGFVASTFATAALWLAGVGLVSRGAGVGVARADTVISADSAAMNVSAFGGALVWSRQVADGRFRLVQRVDGVTRDAPVAVAPHAYNADLGPGRRGGVVAVYSRCRDRVPCDVFQLDLRSGRERKLRRVSTRRCSETAPSIWWGVVAYERAPLFPLDRRCSRGLYVVGARGRPRLLRKGRLQEEEIVETDIRGRTVAAQILAHFGARYSTGILLRKFTRGGSSGCLLRGKVSGGLGLPDEFFAAPSLDAGFLYWSRHESTGNPYDSEAEFVNGFERVRAGCRGAIEIARRDPTLIGPGVADSGTIYYTHRGNVFKADNPPLSFTR